MRQLLLIVCLAAAPLLAQEPTCATDAGSALFAAAVHRANAPRPGRIRPAAAPARVDLRNGMFVVEKTPENSLLDHPNDLEGKSVRFTPSGAGYRASVTPLQYDPNIGSAIRVFANTGAADWTYVKVTLNSVKLSLFGQSVSTLYLTAFNSIALSPPSIFAQFQYDTLEAVSVQEPTIAPLLMTTQRPYLLAFPTVYMREASDGVVVTWRAGDGTFAYNVQAKIGTSGEITFSYKTLGDVTWGAVVVTPGVGAFFPLLTTVAQIDDPADDVPPVLDIRSVLLQEVAGIGGCILTVTTAASPGAMLPPPGDAFVFTVTFGDAPPFTVMLLWNGDVETAQPGRAMRHTSTAYVRGNQVVIGFTVDVLRPIAASTHMTIETSLASNATPANRVTADVALRDGAVPGVELSASDGAELALPIVDAFTWPSIDLQGVWESVRQAASLDDAQIDGVGIYSNFHSDATIANVAFATVGNSQAAGVSKFVSVNPLLPRSPNLMNLNDVVFSNQPPLDAGRVLLHEFGHRWLQYVETMENGTATMTLNPSPAHPPQFASTPAAFPVVNPYDTSTMGGGVFTQSGGTFTSAPKSPYGYSWFDLYLMGLAVPEEVPPMYVIDNSNPPLGSAYNPPGNMTVTGVRHDVAIQQVIDAMGPRRPSAASSQRSFKVVFVMVAAPGRDAGADLVRVDAVRRAFADNFAKATGGRAAVETLFFPASARRRAVTP